METMSLRDAAQVLGVPIDADEGTLRRAYREAAKKAHPDKLGAAGPLGGGAEFSGAAFVRLRQALDLLLPAAAARAAREVEQGVDMSPPPPPPPFGSAKGGVSEKESHRLDKHFFGTQFGSGSFDPRAWTGDADAVALASIGKPVACVWRCVRCPEASSVCCRLKPKKHTCICGHKVEAHVQSRNFSCGAAHCRCARLQFHVQQLGWEVRCRCKHGAREHAASGAAPWRCTKLLPGKEKRLCPCAAFDAAWVCTCGHSWASHQTAWSADVPRAMFAREWVASGVRPECSAEAEEKRAKWEAEAAAVAAKVGGAEASRWAADKAKRVGVSMVAEARMQEAVSDTVDGTRLPSFAASVVLLETVTADSGYGVRQQNQGYRVQGSSESDKEPRTLATPPAAPSCETASKASIRSQAPGAGRSRAAYAAAKSVAAPLRGS